MIVFDSIISVSSNSGGGGGGSSGILAASEYIIPTFLAMIFAAALFSSRTKVPYTMGLVGIGIAISLFLGLARGEVGGLNIVNFNRLDPKLIIDFIIPPLIFEAMMKVDYYNEFKAIRVSALLLSTAGVVIATVVTGLLLMYLAHLPLLIAFTFAALIAPTDAAIVIEIFKRVRVPGLLSTIMESEAALNDATGIIIFSSIITLASYSISINGSGSSSSNIIIANNFSIVYEIGRFAFVFFGGVAIGLGIAAATHRLHSLMNDPFSETALTIATVFGSVVLANSLGFSGLVAVAVAGLYFGNATVKKEADMSLKVRTAVFNFWEMTAFFANSAAFLYLGISMNILRIAENIPSVALSFVAVLVARAVSTYPILAATNRLTREKIPVIWRHVVMLGGMRGAISVALVASIPSTAGEFKTTLETITFGVVLLSLVIQYIALTKYVRKAFPKDTFIATNVDNTNLPED
ncbi:MAG: sodium:proton antiporter [Nitrososphaeraceae archaeon]